MKNTKLTVATFFISLLFGASSYYGFASVMANRHVSIDSDRLSHSSMNLKKNEKKQIVSTNIKFLNGLRWLNSLNKNIELLPIIVPSLKNIKQKNTPQIKIRNTNESHKNNKKTAVIKYKEERKKVKKITVLTESKKAQRKIDKKKKIKKSSYIDKPLERSLGINLVQ